MMTEKRPVKRINLERIGNFVWVKYGMKTS